MYIMQVKKPYGIEVPLGLLSVWSQKMSGEQAFGKLADFHVPTGQEVTLT